MDMKLFSQQTVFLLDYKFKVIFMIKVITIKLANDYNIKKAYKIVGIIAAILMTPYYEYMTMYTIIIIKNIDNYYM